MANMRGLTMFISDIRNSTTKDAETKRIEKELSHIRQQFANKSLDGYSTKKYVWKLLYMYMLGYDVEIGHMEAMRLVAAPKYTEKSTGYVACSVLWNENTEFLRLLVQTLKKDLTPANEFHQSLALTFIANVGGQEFSESLAGDVQKLLISPKSRSFVRKKAALCLLRLFRKNPECVSSEGGFPGQLLSVLDDPSLGVVLSVMGLLLGIASHSIIGYEEAPAKAIYLLAKVAFSKERKSVYRYYLTLCPWLQVKLLRLLQYFPPPTDKNIMARLNHVLNEILTKTAVTKNVNKNNADHSILFEAINVIIHLCLNGIKDLQGNAIGLLGRFVSIREPNFRYLGLETMTRLANIPGTLPAIKKHQEIIQQSLQDSDISIRKRGLDLLYVMCDSSNSKEIVSALLTYLSNSAIELREELVLKIAILAEKFASDLRWYVDVILQLISLAGDFVNDDIWFRVVQIVTNNEDLQDYAGTTCYKFLTSSANIHENGIKVAAYILGEFSDQIKDKSLSGGMIFDALHGKFAMAHFATKAILLSSYIKLSNTYPDLKEKIQAVFEAHRSYIDTEIQQRANEYSVMNKYPNPQLMESVLDVMPNYSERESLLLKKMKKKKRETTDRDVWGDVEEGKKRLAEQLKEKKEKDEEDDDDDEDDEDDEDDDDEDDEEDSDDDEGGGKGSDVDDDEGTERQKQKDKEKKDKREAEKKEKPGVSSSSSQPQQQTIDLFGFGTVNNHSSGADDLFPAQNLDSSLFAKDSGVLYDCKLLQIGLKSTIENNNSCKFIFFYGNRGSNSLKDLVVQLPSAEADAFQIKVRPEEPLEVPPKKQIQHFFLLHCFKPFKGPLNFALKFNYQNSAHTINLAVPILMTHFLVPATLQAEQFTGAWQKFANEVVGVRKLAAAVDVSALQSQLTAAAHMAVVSNVDKNSDNFVAAGTFHTATKTPAGTFVTMPAMIRIETKSGMNVVRITIHSGHQLVSETLLAAITAALGLKE